jgi:hypothetical protein
VFVSDDGINPGPRLSRPTARAQLPSSNLSRSASQNASEPVSVRVNVVRADASAGATETSRLCFEPLSALRHDEESRAWALAVETDAELGLANDSTFFDTE